LWVSAAAWDGNDWDAEPAMEADGRSDAVLFGRCLTRNGLCRGQGTTLALTKDLLRGFEMSNFGEAVGGFTIDRRLGL